ncbi:hypothetical protein RGQ29_031866 [Quercus rubra]|uniref:Receptor-like serine/threonine-protein kinase n=1 Tax=Quercus rubra TaxID=3512 RepID=A0AAN7DUQ2_QUERU|nr:hypothetical protein RGQ29_031866 [Quercus rubra]
MATSTHPQFCCLLLLLLLLPLLPTVFTYTKDDCNKWPISPFVAQPGIGPFIQSPSGEFAFGFHPLQSSEKENQFLLAVWFNKTKDPTIVWSANGNKPAPEGSELKLSSNKEFVLNDPDQDSELWKPQMNGSSKSSCFVMLDNGNLVILDEQYNSIWESFKEPTDTILPGQILPMNTTLRSHQSETNYSDGRFEVALQLDGNFDLILPTMTMQWISVLNFTDDGRMYILDANNSTNNYSLTEKNPGSKESFYHMARIDPDGGFRLYSLPRKENPTSDGLESCSSSSWIEVQSIPDDTCGRFDANFFVGGESSGNGKSILHVSFWIFSLRPIQWLAGCKPNFSLPSCDNGWEANKELVTFKQLLNVDWPLSDYSFLQGVNEAECIQQCLDDCMCVVTVHDKTSDSCVKKKYPLSNGRYSTKFTRKAFIKLFWHYSLAALHFFNILFFSASIVAIIYLYHKRRNSRWNIDSTLATNVRSYTYKELEEATTGFKQTVGKDSKRFVAVKKLGKVVEEGEKEFKTEVSVIGQTHHKKFSPLLGYCDEGQHRLLVYEYMSNGSLASFLFGIFRPHWNQRMQIAFGIAQGLMYLHEECSTQIIHCDIKPQNILLDEYFMPRIADFGLAKLLLAEQSRAARTAIRGTIGYFAPECFGVMLLEIICCKSSIWAYECYKDKKLDKLIENDEEARNDMKRLERLVIVAIWCIQEDPSLRPSMKKVTQMLEGVIEVSVPPSPSLFTSSLPSFKK